jgi:acyl-CoA thioesterase-1
MVRSGAKRRVSNHDTVRRSPPDLLRTNGKILAFVAGCLMASVAGAAQADPAKVLMLGDSIVAGHGLSASDALPVRLEAKLRADGHDVRMINAGVSGDTTAAGLARLDWALGEKPDFAIVELGANDMLRGIDPSVTRENLDTILSRLAAAKVPTLLMGMKAGRNLGTEYAKAFDALYPELARKHGIALYPFVPPQCARDCGDG